MAKEVLITGMEGMAGSHLARAAFGAGYRVLGTYFPGVDLGNISPLMESQQVTAYDCDLTDRSNVKNLLYSANPDVIFHLAGKTSNGKSWDDTTLVDNIAMFQILLQEIAAEKARPKVVLISSVSAYGHHTNLKPWAEDHSLIPDTPYAMSKATQEVLATKYGPKYGIDITVARPSQHTGKGRGEEFVEFEIAKQVAAIEAGEKDLEIRVRNAQAEIDLLDVRDVVRAYLLLARSGVSGEVYNVSSNHPRTIRELAQILVGVSDIFHKEYVEVISIAPEVHLPARYDNQKISSLGWVPDFTLAQTLTGFLGWVRTR